MAEHTLTIAQRAAGARPGSAVLAEAAALDPRDVEAYERLILQELFAGNVPDFQRQLKPVRASGGNRLGATVYAMPEYLCVGSDDDHFIVPLTPLTAQRVCDSWSAALPTRKLVDEIYRQADVRIPFRAMTPQQGFPYDAGMTFPSRFGVHDSWVKKQRTDAGWQPGQLVAGHKKDVVIDVWLEDVFWSRVGVYGAFMNDGRAIHNFTTHSHEARYRDYSHGIRIISQLVYLDQSDARGYHDLLTKPETYRLLSNHKKSFAMTTYPTDGWLPDVDDPVTVSC